VVNRTSVVCTVFAEHIKYLTIVVHASSSSLKLKKLAVGGRLYGYYNLDSAVCFNIRMGWEICTCTLFFIDKVAIPFPTVILSIENLHNNLVGMNRSKLMTK
jgi:hypothetical protein